MFALRSGVTALLLVGVGCGGTQDGSGARDGGDAGPRPAGANNSAPSPQSTSEGSFAVGGTTYTFRVVRCDLSGGDPDGMLLRGGGTTPDGRRLAIEVERVEGEAVVERASVMIGTARDGERWSARRAQGPDGAWFGDEAGQTRASGPLLQISGSGLVVEAAFGNQAGTSTANGVLRASCERTAG